MEFDIPHSWDLSPRAARRLQDDLRARIDLSDRPGVITPHLIAGIDNSYLKSQGRTIALAVVVLLRFPSLEMVATHSAQVEVDYPYIPGLLSFREAPAILAALRKLEREPQVLFFDGHGYAHPRRLGIAAHLGLVLRKPAVGIGKSRLVGEYEQPDQTFGAASWLVDGPQNEKIGLVLRTRPPYKPVFVSPGWGISFETALELTRQCCSGRYRLPEPTRLAHKKVTELRRSLAS